MQFFKFLFWLILYVVVGWFVERIAEILLMELEKLHKDKYPYSRYLVGRMRYQSHLEENNRNNFAIIFDIFLTPFFALKLFVEGWRLEI